MQFSFQEQKDIVLEEMHNHTEALIQASNIWFPKSWNTYIM